MEEAIGTRVRGLFRAAKWQEYSLQVAKAAVRRDFLLQDAIAVMARYSGDSLVCHRRLEVRFEGESGFDAASGDEAGVTRGFYADVAELLVSTETVAGIYCTSRCATGISSSDADKPEYMEVDNESKKLPLWIPDLDDSSQVVIPTPRSNQRSSLGLFPRPIPTYHPQHAEVLQMFRFIGRLFAAAMRDGFMFPLPISPAFLKLVQGAQQLEKTNHITGDHTSNSVLHLILSSNDLPRSGFLGGEVYAADYHICRALGKCCEFIANSPRCFLTSFSFQLLRNRRARKFGSTPLPC
jgi:HECT-domain (ubiquitin-transferase)